jgi:predicted metal-dependent RNase
MSKKMFAAKLAASTRKAKKMTTKLAASTHKAKKMTTKSTKLAASTHKAEKIISKAIPKSTSLTELAYQNDLLNPVDLELFWKKKYLVRIWPD